MIDAMMAQRAARMYIADVARAYFDGYMPRMQHFDEDFDIRDCRAMHDVS